jgi:hypothetical protein
MTILGQGLDAILIRLVMNYDLLTDFPALVQQESQKSPSLQ